MLEDYCNRLQELQKDKNKFLKLKYKANTKIILEKQQNKYHKYILSQISYKNRLDSVFLLNQTFNGIVRKNQRESFNNVLRNISSKKDILDKQNQVIELQMNHKQLKNQTTSLDYPNKNSISIEKSKLKQLSCKFLLNFFQTRLKQNKKQSFVQIQNKNKRVKKIQNLFYLFQQKIQCQKNGFLNKLKIHNGNKSKKLQPKTQNSKSFIFSLNEFSEIMPYTIQQEEEDISTSGVKNIEEIDSKFKPSSSSKLSILEQRETKNQYILMLESLQKLKQQVVLMKNILGQKNKQLKTKDEQICKVKKQYQKKIQVLHDEMSQRIQKQFELHNSKSFHTFNKVSGHSRKDSQEYLKQLQVIVIGDRHQETKSQENQNINQQLLQKYMRQSFQMREKMDMARQMCQQFQFDSRTNEGQIMIAIIRLLTPEQRLNAFVD